MCRTRPERRTIHIPDVHADPEYTYGVRDVDVVRTVLAVPILKGDDLLGVMLIYHVEVRPFTAKQIALVETFADQAAIAIENVRLLDALRQRTNELGRSVDEQRALGEVSQAVNSTLDLETVLSTIVANSVQLSGTEAGAIYVLDDLQREFHLRATYGMDQELIDTLTQQHIGMDEPNVVTVFAEREPLQIADLKERAPSAVNEIIMRAGFRAVLVAPLLRGEKMIGMLVVRRHAPGAFPQSTIDLIKTFAAQSAVAIENARLFQNVEASLEDLRTAQDRLVQTQKLASLGQLTAGIAHEIKNPLNFVNNFSGVSTELIDELREALGRMTGDDKTRREIAELTDTLRDNLDKIVQHGKRADAIVKNMLLHSREGSGEHRLVDANALVEESLNLAYHGARAEKQGFKITLERSFDPAAGRNRCVPAGDHTGSPEPDLERLLCGDQAQRANNSDGYEPTLAASTKNLGDQVEIRIRDNGTGVSPEVREKMFNPFFTTKPAGEGTGLGLSITHDIIVKQHSGIYRGRYDSPESSPRSELFCREPRRLSLTSEDGRNPTAVLPGLVRGDEATRTQPYDASSSSSAFASFRSRVSKPFGEPAVNRSQQFARLLHLALVAPEPCEAHCGAEFPGFCLLLTRDRERALEIGFRFRRIRLAATCSAISPAMRLTSASHHLSLVVSTAVIASPMQRQASSNWPSSA